MPRQPALQCLPLQRGQTGVKMLRWGRGIVIGTVLLTVCALPAAAAPRSASSRRSPAELAAEVVRTTVEYRAVVARALPGYEADLQEATETLEERESLYKLGLLPASYIAEAARAHSIARRNLDEARTAIEEADRIVFESSIQARLMKLPSLAPGGYDDTAALVRFNGRSRWSLQELPKLDQRFRAAFGRALPLSAVGQTNVHDRLGLDHRAAVDVAVHPDSAEGRWLLQHLRQAGIPFIGVRSAIPGSATGAHVHVGGPSTRWVAR
jgi:hypothetical protein